MELKRINHVPDVKGIVCIIVGLVASMTSAHSSFAQTSSNNQEEVVKEAGPSQSVRDVLREEHTLFSNRLTIEPGITYSYSDRSQLALNGFLALDAIFLGLINVDDVESHITTFDLAFSYGLTNRLQLGFNLPFVYRSSTYETTGCENSTSQTCKSSVDDSDLGDINASLYYRLLTETPTTPDVVWNIGVRAPTGSDPYGIATRQVEVENGQDPGGNLNIPTELPTGNGVWGITSGFSVLKTLDPAIVFASLGYTYNLEDSFDIRGEAYDIKLGDSINMGFGTAFALNEGFSLSMSYSHQVMFDSEQDGQEITGSNANVGVFNIGATYALSNTTSVVTNLGIGLTDDASDVTLTFRMPFQI